jgi:DNA-binding CsgD family transcriptional regulator
VRAASQALRPGSRPSPLESSLLDLDDVRSRPPGVPDDGSVVGLDRAGPVLPGALLGADPEDPTAVALEGEPLVFVHVQVPVAREDDRISASGIREPRGVSSRLCRVFVPVELGEGQAPVAAVDDPLRARAPSCSRTPPPEQLADAVRTVHAGNALLAPEATRTLIRAFVRTGVPTSLPPEELRRLLTPRELEVPTLLARGRSNAEIAADLVSSEATAKTHVGHLLTKLGLRDRAQAIVLAYQTRPIEP